MTLKKVDATPVVKDTTTTAPNNSIRLTSPTADSAMTSPMKIAGEVSPEVTSLGVRIKNTKGETLIEEAVRARAGSGDVPGLFEVHIEYQFTSTKEGLVEVYVRGEDGSEKDAVTVPVRFE